MNPGVREAALRAAAIVGVAVSVLLIAEYAHPLPALCGPGGGCEIVRQSQYARLLGVPLPFIGLAFFGVLLGTSMVPQMRRWLFPLASAGAAAALGFIGIQAFVLHAFCRLCLVVDVTALLLAGLAFTLRGVRPPRPRLVSVAAYPGAAVAAALGALVWHATLGADAVPALGTSEVPPVVQQEQKPDRVTIVEFVDFQCPACRAQHNEFSSVLDQYAASVHVVIKNVPLPQHQHAIDAARAFCCAEENGEAQQMAERLFVADGLRPEDCEDIAVSLGLDRGEFRRCMSSERVAARLQADKAAAASAGVRGLPTFWIGHERFEGVHDNAALRSSIDRAVRRGASS